jgi:CBS domain-containing protein
VIVMPSSAGDIMATAVTRVRPQTQLTTVMGLLRERAVTAVPVVDESDRVVGIVSAMDLVDDQPHSVTPQTSLRTAARLLQTHDIHHLPVVADGKLVGMITRRDLLATFLRADEQVRREIAHAAQITFNAMPDQVAVTVHSGVVRLEGQVGLRSIARELEGLAAATDGVVAVEPRLQWDLDDIHTDTETNQD